MILTAVTPIRESLGFDAGMTDVTAAITAALHAATPYLAAVLNTRLDREEVVDTFFVREPSVLDGDHVETEFRLSRGFVHEITGTYGDRPADVREGRAITLPNDTFRVDWHKGVVSDFETRYVRNYVRFAYTAGFEVEEVDGVEAYSDVPDWLAEAAKLHALIALAKSPTISNADVNIDTAMFTQQLSANIQAHRRYAPAALLPM